MCSICCETKQPVVSCLCNEMEDKRICETCAVALHKGCDNITCNCFTFTCAFCRQTEEDILPWTNTSVLYWKQRATDLADRLERCALEMARNTLYVSELLATLEHVQEDNNSLVEQLNDLVYERERNHRPAVRVTENNVITDSHHEFMNN
mgnify:CR=1 FL=1